MSATTTDFSTPPPSISRSPSANILLKKESSSHSHPNQSTPRTLSIRFAPLPDPRASRANVPGTLGQLDVWWTREEKPDGTWGDYRLVLRRSNGEIVAIDDLDPASDERTLALESYRQQLPSRPPPSSPLHHLFSTNSCDPDSNQNPHLLCPSNITSSDPQAALSKLLPSLSTQSSNLTNSSSTSNLHSAGSNASSNLLALTPTTSCDSTHSNYSLGSNHKSLSSASLAKKLIDAMKKPISSNSHRLTPTNSLPINGDYFGEPLCKSRSAESTTGSIRKRFSLGFSKNNQTLRRTRSKEEESSTQSTGFPLDEPPARRRSNYPPVAQRKAHMGGGRGGAGRVALTEEPDFVEWKPAATTTSTATVASSSLGHSVDDDGSGMAWLRRRKKEREERAQREEEERTQVLGDASRLMPLATIDESQLVSDDLNNPVVTIDLDIPSPSRAVDLESNPEEEKRDADRDSSASSIYESSILSRDDAHASGGTRTSTSSATLSYVEDDEDLNEEELKEEERLKALALSQSPFVKGASEVYRDREHHQILRKSTEIN